MARLYTLVFIFILSTASLFGQLVITPSPASASGPSSGLVKAIAEVENTSANPIDCRWERINVNIPSGWQTAVCDKIRCHAAGIYTEEFTLDPGEVGNMSVWFSPNNIDGSGMVEVWVYDITDSLNVTVLNSYEAIAGNVAVNNVIEEQYRIYPNPAVNFVQLPKVTEVQFAEIYNLTGKLVERVNLEISDRKHFVGDLNRGIYLVRLMDKDGALLYTTKMTKQ